MPDPKTGTSRVNSPGVVDADEPVSGEADAASLEDSMKRASRGDASAVNKLDNSEALKRRVARGGERQNDPGN